MTQPISDYCAIRLPEIFTTTPISSLVGHADAVRVLVSWKDLSQIAAGSVSEVIGIQRLITLATEYPDLGFEWEEAVANRVFASPSLFPVLSVLLCLEGVSHSVRVSHDRTAQDCRAAVLRARKNLLSYRLKVDAFMDCQILVCADSLGQGYPPDLYARDGRLNDTEGMESLVEDLMVRHLATGTKQSRTYRLREALGVILSELIENTEIHAKKDMSGNPISKNGLRGLIIKRVQRQAKASSLAGKIVIEPIDYLELSIFDSGIGFYPSFTRHPVEQYTPLADEWRVVQHCLQRHVDVDIADARPGYRGMGLYEVLRALMDAEGSIEIRTGRVCGYRTFLKGDLRMQLEHQSSDRRPGMPRPVLLDAERKFVTVPTQHEPLKGSSVRVLFPLR